MISCDRDNDYTYFDLTKNQIDILFVSKSEEVSQIYAVQDSILSRIMVIILPNGIKTKGFADPAWSNDPRKFVLSNYEEMLSFPYLPIQANIYIIKMNVDTPAFVPITNDKYQLDTLAGIITPVLNLSPDWSPDSKSLVYISNRSGRFEIYKVFLDNSLHIISPHQRLTGPSDSINEYCYPAYSPSGVELLYTSIMSSGKEEIWLMDTSGIIKRQITSTNATQTRRPRFSPDGSAIVFYSNLWINNSDSLQIYTIKPDGSDLDTITRNGNCYDPYWKFDGQKIIYAKKTSYYSSYIYIIDSNGTNEKKFINDSRASYPAWRPKKPFPF